MIKFIPLLLIAAANFFLISFLVWHGLFTNFDIAATGFLQTLFPRSLDLPFSLFSLLGSSEVFVLILLTLFIIIYLKFHKFFWSLGTIVLIYLLEIVGKLFIYHPGPPPEFFRNVLPFDLPSGYVHTNYSFPSGHISRTAFLIVILAFLSRRPKFYILYSIFYILMFVSRIYLGEHWFSDVLGGSFLGTFFGLVSALFLKL